MIIRLTSYEDDQEKMHFNIDITANKGESAADVAKAYKEVVKELEEGEAK